MSSLNNQSNTQVSSLGQLLRDALNRQQQGNNMNFERLNTSVTARTARGKFIVGSVTDGAGFSASNSPVLHANATSASAECTRLAAANPGKTFVYLQVCGGAVTNAVTKF